MPLRLGDGGLIAGHGRARWTRVPTPNRKGIVAKRFSADGSHLVFATAAKLEPDANSNGDLTVYDRDLAAGTTTVVSKTPAGQTMTGPASPSSTSPATARGSSSPSAPVKTPPATRSGICT